MSGELQPPLLTSAQAETLLDQVVYEQVLECIDLEALCRIEQSLALLVGELEGVSGERIVETARAMVDRALARIPGELRGYLRAACWPPVGSCALCAEEVQADEARAAEARAGNHASVRHAPARLKS